MGNSRTAMVASFMDIFLADVLDFLDLDELLLCAMPVSKCWREQALNHPTYWRHLFLHNYKGFSPNRASQSVDLFLLRLSRTLDRPIEIDITWDDLVIFGPHIVQHLSHLRRLYLYGPLSSANALLDALRLSNAPLLEWMVLHFQPEFDRDTTPDIVTLDIPELPHDLFSSHAPQLKTVHLENTTLLPELGFPTCLSQITSLGFNISIFADWPLERRRLLNISQYFPYLRALVVGEGAVLDDPVFWKGATWKRLDTVGFSQRLWDGRGPLALPISGVRSVDIFCLRATEVIDLAKTITGPISLAMPYPTFSSHVEDPIISVAIRMSTMDGSSHRERWVHSVLQSPEPDTFPLHAITAFQHAGLAERIERLEISLEDWDGLVGAGYVVRLPTLRILVLLLREAPGPSFWRMPAETSVLSCPCVTQLVLKRANEGPVRPRVQAAQVAAFARQALPDTPFPLLLERNEVTLDGASEDFPEVFSESIVTRVGRSG